MSKLHQPDASTPASTSSLETAITANSVHPQDRIYSGMFGNGRVIELLKTTEGFAYGHRIVFENGMEAQLLITELPTRH